MSPKSGIRLGRDAVAPEVLEAAILRLPGQLREALLTVNIRGFDFDGHYDELSLVLAFYCLEPRLCVAFRDNEVRQRASKESKALESSIKSSIRKSARVVAEERGKTLAQIADEDQIAALAKEVLDEVVPAAPEGRALMEARAKVDLLTDVCVGAPDKYPYLSRSIAVRWLCFLFATTRETTPERAKTRIDELNGLLRELPSEQVAAACRVSKTPERVGDSIDVPLLVEYREFYRSISGNAQRVAWGRADAGRPQAGA